MSARNGAAPDPVLAEIEGRKRVRTGEREQASKPLSESVQVVRRLRCAVCERTIERLARQQLYCSTRCRMTAFREKTPVAAGYTGGVTNPHKSASKIKELQASKSGSRLFSKAPLNLLGGYRWPDTMPVDAKTRAKVTRSEIGSVVMPVPDDGWIDWPPSEAAP